MNAGPSAPAARAEPRPPWWPVWLYVLVAATYLAFGYSVRIPFDAIHLIEHELLATRPLESLWHWHAQPPLPNVVLAAAMALARATGIATESLLLPLQLALGVVTVRSIAWLAYAVLRRKAAVFVAAATACYPPLHEFVFVYYFVAFEIACLAWLPGAAAAYALRPTAARFASICAAAVVLTWSRSLFHPIFAVVVVVGIAWLRALPGGPAPRRRVAWTIATLALLAAWPVKNLVQFGVAGYSSWQGAQLVRQLPVPVHPLLPLWYVPFVEPIDPRLQAAKERADALVPAELRDVPVVARTHKASGAPNWNHFAMIDYGREQQAAAVAAMWAHPAAVWAKVERHYIGAFVRSPLRHPLDDSLLLLAVQHPVLVGFATFVERVTLGTLGPSRTPLFAYVFPVLFVAITITLVRRARRRHADPTWLPCVVAFAGLAWITGMALLVDGEEANRMRLPTDAPFLALVVWVVAPRVRAAASDHNSQ